MNFCFSPPQHKTTVIYRAARTVARPLFSLSHKFTWRRCGPSEGPRWAQGNPFGRICICTDATAWTTGRTSAAPATATAAPAAAGAAAAAAAAVAAAAVAAVAAESAAWTVAAARRPAGSEARCPVPIW